LEKMTDNVVISKIDVLMCLLLSKAGKHVPYGEFVGVTEFQVTEANSSLDRIRIQ
jgi:hypothetical protein